MDTFKNDIAHFFSRDLNKLANEVTKISDSLLWEDKAGISNSCGVLAQHIVGNLNHYLGTCLGDTGYERDRDREFINTGESRSNLVEDIRETAVMAEEVLLAMDNNQLSKPYKYFSTQDFTTGQFLIHLYGHLNYHLGQVNYLRRILTENNG